MVCGASVVDDVASSTANVIASLRDESNAAKKRFSDPAKIKEIDQELDTIGHQHQADFDANQYSERQHAYSEFAQRASEKAKQSSSETNATKAEEVLDEAEEALHKMNKVGDELDAMEKDLHHKLRHALNAKLDPELKDAAKFAGVANHLQSEAHTMMDPLYSWGDAAENKADKLNDQTNVALSSVEKVVRKYSRHITDHSRSVQRSVDRKLFGDKGEDRVATWRKVHREVRSANGHVYLLQQATAGLMGLPLMGGFTLLVTATAAAVVGASVAGFVLKSRAPKSSQYMAF